MDCFVELEVNRDQIDANFDGYKLSLDPLPVYEVSLAKEVDECDLTEDQYSYQHIKAFGIQNSLFQDPWHPDHVYYLDKEWSICRYRNVEGSRTGRVDAVLKLPDSANQQLVTGRHGATLEFPADSVAALADGAGRFYLIETGNRAEDADWKIVYKHQSSEEGRCFVLLHSMYHVDGEVQTVEALLLHVEKSDVESVKSSKAEKIASQASGEGEDMMADTNQSGVSGQGGDTMADTNGTEKSTAPAFVTHLEWLTFKFDPSIPNWFLSRTRRMSSQSSPDYAAIEPRGSAIVVAAEKQFKFVFDSERPIEAEETPEAKLHIPEARPPPYTWMQDETDVDVQFTVPSHVSKADVLFTLNGDYINLAVKDGPTLLSGSLHHRVDISASTWTLSDNKLEVHLSKAEEARTWSEVVQGDTRGELVKDEAQVQSIHERLQHITSEIWNADPEEGLKKAYNAQELEECDVLSEAASNICRFDGSSHQVTHQVNLDSHQWLFTTQLTPGSMPAFCLRHDVDGLLWQPHGDAEPGKSPWQHKATFNALGYVQASKTQKKFAGCAPDQSFAVICDCLRHVYVYRQPSAILSPLRNRKTGRTVSALAKQQVASLQTVDNFLGLRISKSRIYALARNMLYVIAIAPEA